MARSVTETRGIHGGGNKRRNILAGKPQEKRNSGDVGKDANVASKQIIKI
jgi:hypothetical protein